MVLAQEETPNTPSYKVASKGVNNHRSLSEAPMPIQLMSFLSVSGSYYIVSDEDYSQLPKPEDEQSYYAWQAQDGKDRVIAASEKLYKKLPRSEIIITY